MAREERKRGLHERLRGERLAVMRGEGHLLDEKGSVKRRR